MEGIIIIIKIQPLAIANVLSFLSGFVWIHLPLLNTDTALARMFSIGNVQITSKEVIMCAFRAILFIVKALYTPIHAQESLFPRSNVYRDSETVILSQNEPSPALAYLAHGMNLYLISSAAILASRTEKEDVEETKRQVTAVIVPCMERLATIWPISVYFLTKLRGILEGGDARYWAQEANRY